jgi:DNA-binding Lrp family transcriptional regulator
VSSVEEVADLYVAAAFRGEGPTKAVADHLGFSRATAGRRVAEAKARGLIPPDSARRNPKVTAVAEALGVSYEDLMRAIHDHADGDLRV